MRDKREGWVAFSSGCGEVTCSGSGAKALEPGQGGLRMEQAAAVMVEGELGAAVCNEGYRMHI